MARVRAQFDLVMSAGNSKRLCEFARAGANLAEIVNAAASLHQVDPRRGSSARIKTKPFVSPFTSTFNIQCTP